MGSENDVLKGLNQLNGMKTPVIVLMVFVLIQGLTAIFDFVTNVLDRQGASSITVEMKDGVHPSDVLREIRVEYGALHDEVESMHEDQMRNDTRQTLILENQQKLLEELVRQGRQ